MPATTVTSRIATFHDLLAAEAPTADRRGTPSPAVLDALRGCGLLGLAIPTEYGGGDADARSINQAVTEVARRDPSLAIILFQHAAVSRRIVEAGDPAQRRAVLPRLASGEWLAASAWSETGAGAAKKNLATTALRTRSGWILDGGKSFTTGAGLADIYLVLAQTTPAVDELSTYGGFGQSFFLVPAQTAGVVADTGIELVGMRASATGFLRLTDVLLPGHALLGPVDRASELIARVRESGMTLGAVALGIAEAAFDAALATVGQRGSGADPVLRHRLADLGAQLEAVRAVVDRAGRRESPDPGVTTLYSKIFATQTAESLVNGVTAVLGSSGFVAAHPLNRLLRDVRAVALMGPTNELSRELVSRPWIR